MAVGYVSLLAFWFGGAAIPPASHLPVLPYLLTISNGHAYIATSNGDASLTVDNGHGYLTTSDGQAAITTSSDAAYIKLS